MEEYFRIVVDPTSEYCWFPDEPLDVAGNEVDARVFLRGQSYAGSIPLIVPAARDGVFCDFVLGAFDMPVVSEQVMQAFEQSYSDDVELIAARVEGSRQRMYIVNVKTKIDCIDTQLSGIEYFPDDYPRRDKAGKYASIYDMKIDRISASGHEIFRIMDYEIALIVSGSVRRVLSEGDYRLGVEFLPV